MMRFDRIGKFLSKLGKSNNLSLVITIDGYNDVVEELYEIPAVKKWSKGLIQKCPHIFYFLENDISESARIMLLNIFNIQATAYMGEVKKPIAQYSLDEIRKLPRTNAYVVAESKELARIAEKTIEFGASIGDAKGGIVAAGEIVMMFDK